MERAKLERRLADRYDASSEARRVVVRQAGDLADSGQYAATHSAELTAEIVLDNLTDAPEEMDLVERWNWWIGALNIAREDYDRFRIRRFATE